MLELKFRYRFEAAHRFTSSASHACTTPHGHTWHGSLTLEFVGTRLNSDSMAVEFSELKSDWRKLLTQTFDHSYLHHWQDPVAEAAKLANPEARTIPFPGDPTTELIALLLFHKMETIIAGGPYASLVKVQSILVEETATNHVICDREFYHQEIPHHQKFAGWWSVKDTSDRSLALRS